LGHPPLGIEKKGDKTPRVNAETPAPIMRCKNTVFLHRILGAGAPAFMLPYTQRLICHARLLNYNSGTLKQLHSESTFSYDIQ